MHRLLNRSREITGLVLADASNRVILLLEAIAANPDRNGGEQKQQAENPVECKQNSEADDDCDAVGDKQHQAEREPTANQAEVTRGTAEQLTAWPLVVKSYWKILQLGIEGSAKAGLNVGAGG